MKSDVYILHELLKPYKQSGQNFCIVVGIRLNIHGYIVRLWRTKVVTSDKTYKNVQYPTIPGFHINLISGQNDDKNICETQRCGEYIHVPRNIILTMIS